MSLWKLMAASPHRKMYDRDSFCVFKSLLLDNKCHLLRNKAGLLENKWRVLKGNLIFARVRV